jgi:dUTPase
LILMEPIEVDSLDDTERGDKGFGSSGKWWLMFTRV